VIAPPIVGRDPRALLVGESPSRTWDGTARTLLVGPAFRRLAGVLFAGHPAPYRRYLEAFARSNVVLLRAPDPWPAVEAAARARSLWDALFDLPLVVLGRRAADSFRLDLPLPGGPVTVDGRRVLVLPHPSGLCRLWSDPAVAEDCRDRFLRLRLWDGV
jgi:uracil-DNA glycosylase